MATSEFVSKPQKSVYSPQLAAGYASKRRSTTQAAVTAAMMMATDVLAVLFSLCLASIFRFSSPGPFAGRQRSELVWTGAAVAAGIPPVLHRQPADRESQERSLWPFAKAQFLARIAPHYPGVPCHGVVALRRYVCDAQQQRLAGGGCLSDLLDHGLPLRLFACSGGIRSIADTNGDWIPETC